MEFISLGCNCHPSGNLQKLKLRNKSLPFDWLLVKQENVFEYINSLINTDFKDFTKKLTYNHRKKVISKNYEYVEFFHYDLIKNITINRPTDKNKNLIETMNRRGKRFMDIIKSDKKIVFICCINHDKLNKKIYDDMVLFEKNSNIKCNYKVLVYLLNTKDYKLDVPEYFLNLKKFIFDKYVKNIKYSKIYGDPMDFKKMLERNKLILNK